jgi:hypothetical protein
MKPMRAAVLPLILLLPILIALPHMTLAAGDESGGAGSPDGWFARSDRAKEGQPHWMTPVVTVTPRLEQEFRYDQIWQSRPDDVTLDSWGGGKGLELIPTEKTEVIVGVPAYQVRTSPDSRESGFADETLLLKYRMLSANEESGNCIITGFLGLSLPTGADAFTTDKWIVTPTLAGGKGWGTRARGFDIQSTLGAGIPSGDRDRLGVPIVSNTTFQAHVSDKLWPEIEANITHWAAGPNSGSTQTVITAGLIAGRYKLGQRARFAVGAGYQRVVSSFRAFDDAWILTVRFPF